MEYTDTQLIGMATSIPGMYIGIKSARKWLRLMKTRFPKDYNSMKIFGITQYPYEWLSRIGYSKDYMLADYETIRALLKIDGEKEGKKLFITQHKSYNWSDKSIIEKYKNATGKDIYPSLF